MSEAEFKNISATFKKQAKNGQIQRKDFIKVMTKNGGMGEELANQLFDSFDSDHSGYEVWEKDAIQELSLSVPSLHDQ